MLEFDFTFPRSHEVEELRELPGTGEFRVPPGKSKPEHNGLWLRVQPNCGKAWVGVFAFGYRSHLCFSRVVSALDPNRVVRDNALHACRVA